MKVIALAIESNGLLARVLNMFRLLFGNAEVSELTSKKKKNYRKYSFAD